MTILSSDYHRIMVESSLYWRIFMDFGSDLEFELSWQAQYW